MENRNSRYDRLKNFDPSQISNNGYAKGYADALDGKLHEPPPHIKRAGDAEAYTKGFTDARK